MSVRASDERLEISAVPVSHREVRLAAQRAQKMDLEALSQRLGA